MSARREAGWAAGLLALVGALCAMWPAMFPPVPSPLALTIRFPAGVAERTEPIITTGAPGDGDFLAVQYLDAHTAVFIYDVWGVGGPRSEPFALKPGAPLSLEITMPTLAHVSSVRSHEKRPLRIVLEGRELLRADVFFHRRQPREIAFAVNPLGGTLVAERFGGTLTRAGDDRPLRGGAGAMFSWWQRLGWMLTKRWHWLLASLAGAAALGLAVHLGLAVARMLMTRWSQRRRTIVPVFPGHVTPPHRWFTATAAACTLAFTAAVTGGTFRLGYADSFGIFYDFQAASLLQGRLDVPKEALQDEFFTFEGRHYGYFGPTPAILRLPFALAQVGFGKLSRGFMVAEYLACLAAVYALLIHTTRLATGRATWPPWTAVVLFVGVAGLGTTLFFLASRAYIYHEAILCGVAFALWGGYCSLRFLAEPQTRWWLGAVACGVLSVHARPPVGLFALSMLGTSALAIAGQRWRQAGLLALPRPLAIAGLAALGVLSFNGLSYLKFRSFDGAPLKYHVQYTPERLAAIGGRNFHVQNLPYNLACYTWYPAFALRPQFPYFQILGINPQTYPDSRIDLAEPVLAPPYAMPAVVFLALAGGTFAFARWPAARMPLAVVFAAALPMTGALLTAIAVSHRYTADFLAALCLSAAFGVTALEIVPPKWRRAMQMGIALLALVSVLITVAITLRYQGEVVWGVPDDVKQNYQNLRRMMDSLLGSARS